MAEEVRIDAGVTDVMTVDGFIYDPIAGILRVANGGTRRGVPAGRRDAHLGQIGVLGESCDPLIAAVTGATLATQSVFGSGVFLRAQDVVTGIGGIVTVAAGGTLPTTVRVGLADSTGKVLAISGNLKALTSFVLGPQVWPLAAAYTVLADGWYYPVIVKNGTYGTTEPQIATLTFVDASAGASFSALLRSFIWTGQTDLPTVAASLTLTGTSALHRYLAVLGAPSPF